MNSWLRLPRKTAFAVTASHECAAVLLACLTVIFYFKTGMEVHWPDGGGTRYRLELDGTYATVRDENTGTAVYIVEREKLRRIRHIW